MSPESKLTLKDVVEAAEILLAAKGSAVPYGYASWEQKEEIEKALEIWDKYLAGEIT